MAQASSSAERPLPVGRVNGLIKGWIERLGYVWVEGQLTQVNYKETWALSYLTLRDVSEESSLSLTCPSSIIRSAPFPVRDGDRVVVCAKPNYYPKRGTFSLRVSEIRPVGVGELLARIERLRQSLADEGLFDKSRKTRPPFLPRRVGLITGKDSAAERDVMSVARDRWPAVAFEVRNTPVQGAGTVPRVVEALKELDKDPAVDVIIIARGGGSVEDLLPFSEEELVRAVAAARTPVVSAIGHEPDHPVLDNVADLRAATPTDAAKRVVPDVAGERELLADLRARAAESLRRWVRTQRESLRAIATRPSVADPTTGLRRQREETRLLGERSRRAVGQLLERHRAQLASLRSSVAALGPAATLERGYSIVQVKPRDGGEPEVVTSVEQAPPGSQLRIRVADGAVLAAGIGVSRAGAGDTKNTGQTDSVGPTGGAGSPAGPEPTTPPSEQ